MAAVTQIGPAEFQYVINLVLYIIHFVQLRPQRSKAVFVKQAIRVNGLLCRY